MSHGLKIAFAGTPMFAAQHLQALIDSHHTLVSVYTQPDRRSGRGKKITPGPVKNLAIEAGLTVLQPTSLKPLMEQERLRQLNPDVMVVVAYGLLLPQHILDTPRFGCLNVHASLLPRWRGAAPVQRAIEAGDRESGITIMQMDAGLDTGEILLKVPCSLDSRETSGSLLTKLSTLGPEALLEVLDQIMQRRESREVQNNDRSTYAKKLSKLEANINWHDGAEMIDRKIRAFNPSPVCFTHLDDTRLKIFSAHIGKEAVSDSVVPGEVINASASGVIVACGKGSINITCLQSPGKKPMQTHQFLHGHSHFIRKGVIFRQG